MDLNIWLQVASLASVASALVFGGLQNLYVARQNREITAQTRAASETLEQGAYQALIDRHNESRILFFKDDPELLAWHFSTRGYATSSHAQNKKKLYVLTKLDLHEANYLSYMSGQLTDDVWRAWKRVLEVDFTVPEFRDLWSEASDRYAPSFGAFIRDFILAPPTPQAS